ncbi:MAG: phage major capsid protein [Bacteroidota bacterium]|nr:phage major capsid protein [Bacteroidota bacterium]
MEVIQLSKEQFVELQKTMIDTVVKELGLDRVDAKYKINPQGDEANQLQQTKKQRFVDLLRLIHSKQYEKIMSQSLSEGVNADGGYLVPEEVRKDILHFVNEYGVLRRLCTYFDLTNIKTDTLNIPRMLTDVAVAWINEKAAITESNMALDNVQIQLKKLAAISTVTEELLEDSLIVLYDFLMERFGEKIAYAEDEQGFSGTGAPFTGVLNTAGTNVITLAGPDITSLSYDDLVDMQAITAAKLKGARWFGSPQVFAECRKIKDMNGNPILQVANASPITTMMGYPIEIVDAMPAKASITAGKPFLVFGNARHIGMIGKGEIAFKISDTAVVGDSSMFELAEQALRVMERVGTATLLPAGFSVAKTAAE